MRKYILLFISLSFFFVTCNDEDFLNKEPHSLTDKAFYTSPTGALQGLNAAYDILQYGERVERIEFAGTVCSGDAMAGGEPGGNDQSNLQNLMKFLIFPNNAYVANYWTMMYRGIYRCNIIISYLTDESIELETGFTDELRDRIVGEATFLRGLYHFKLQINFGGYPQLNEADYFNGELMGVPFIDKVLPPEEWEQTRPELEETWNKIEEDFATAATLLPSKLEYAAEDAGRATSGAALAMLAKTHLYQEEWQEAYDAALQVINSGDYYLLGSNEDPGPYTVERLTKEGIVEVDMVGYKYIFQPEANNCRESIFDVQHFQQGSGNYPEGQEGNLIPQYYGPRAVWAYDNHGDLVETEYFWGFILPTDYFISTAYADIGCEPTAGNILDPRYKLSVVDKGDSVPYIYTNETLRAMYPDSLVYDSWFNWPTPGRCTWKYFTDPIFFTNTRTLGDYPQNTKYMRYADLLLIGAEAAVHIGQTADALAWINKVRERARNCGTTGYPQPLSSVTVEDVWAERRVELAFEGHQFYDIIRTKRAQQVLKEDAMNYADIINPVTSEEGYQQFGDAFELQKHEIWPIPEIEMDNSAGSIAQNPRY